MRLTDNSGPASSRFGWGMVLCLILVWGTAFVDNMGFTKSAFAQDGEATPAAEEPAGDDSGSEAPRERSFLMWMIEASGIFGAILLVISIIMVSLITTSSLQVKREFFIPENFVSEFQQKLDSKDYKGAYEYAKADDSLLARMMAAGMSRLDRGYASALEGMQEIGDDENMTHEHKISYLALIASVAPMVGLMGTVYGMVLSFQKISTSTVAPKPSELADGIATALFTTIEGLAVAIPAMVAFTIFRNRLSRYMLEVGVVSEGLMSRLPIAKQQPQA